MNDPKKKKPLAPPPEEGPPKDLGGIRPKTTDAGKRRINMLRRFHGGLIGTKASNMEMINNVFTDGSKKDIVSLSVYNNSRSYRNGKYTHSATHLPGTNARTGFRPQSAPFEFADGTSFNLSIRQDKGEEIAEIDSLKNRLAAEDISFKVDTLKKAFEMPEENEFQVKKYPDVANYLMKNPFPKKKKKKKGKGRKKRRK